MALARGAEQVRPPEREHARVVPRRVGVLGGEAQAPGLQLANDVLGHGQTLRLGRVGKLERVAVEARVGRHPAEPSGERVAVGQVHVLQRPAPHHRCVLAGPCALVAPLVGGEEPERGRRLLAGRPAPVEGEGERRPAGDRAHLLLADVVRPAAPVHALAAAEQHEVEHRPVDLVGVVPVVRARSHHDHGAAVRPLCVAGELAGDADHPARVDARVLLLPGRRVRLRVVVALGPVSGQLASAHAELGGEQVEHRRDEVAPDPPCGNAAAVRTAALRVADVEARQLHLDELIVGAEQGQRGLEPVELQVPLAHSFLAPAEADRAVGYGGRARLLVEDDPLPLGVPSGLAEVGCAKEAVGHEAAVLLAQRDEERQVGVLARIAFEVRHLPVDVELLQDHVAHRHRKGAVRAGRRGKPVVGELRVTREVG